MAGVERVVFAFVAPRKTADAVLLSKRAERFPAARRSKF